MPARAVLLPAALAAVLAALPAGSAGAAGWLEMNFYLSGPRYDGVLPPCDHPEALSRIARRFNQKSKFGAFIDPLADKFLLITAIVFLSAFPWGPEDWRMPPWFAWLVITRDALIAVGIYLVKRAAHEVHYSPHWTGKVCTVTQMIAIGWVMLKVNVLPPVYPCILAAVFTLWSAVNYYLEASRQIHKRPAAQP